MRKNLVIFAFGDLAYFIKKKKKDSQFHLVSKVASFHASNTWAKLQWVHIYPIRFIHPSVVSSLVNMDVQLSVWYVDLEFFTCVATSALAGYDGNPIFIFPRIFVLISIVTVLMDIPTNSVKGSFLPISSPVFVVESQHTLIAFLR